MLYSIIKLIIVLLIYYFSITYNRTKIVKTLKVVFVSVYVYILIFILIILLSCLYMRYNTRGDYNSMKRELEEKNIL